MTLTQTFSLEQQAKIACAGTHGPETEPARHSKVSRGKQEKALSARVAKEVGPELQSVSRDAESVSLQ